MEELAIERLIGKDSITITLTEDELEKAYRIKEKRYLEEDFANALADAAQNPDTRFHTGHLEEFPELLNWLCVCFDDFYDANMSHNDLMELTLNHLQDPCRGKSGPRELSGHDTTDLPLLRAAYTHAFQGRRQRAHGGNAPLRQSRMRQPHPS